MLVGVLKIQNESQQDILEDIVLQLLKNSWFKKVEGFCNGRI